MSLIAMHIRHYHEVLPLHKAGGGTTQGQSYRARKRKKIIPRIPIGPPAIFTRSSVDNSEFVIYDMFGRPGKM